MKKFPALELVFSVAPFVEEGALSLGKLLREGDATGVFCAAEPSGGRDIFRLILRSCLPPWP